MQVISYEDSSKTFRGVRFVLLGFDSAKAEKVRMKLLQGGGEDTFTNGPDCTHVIVENLVYDDPVCLAARNDGKVLVTAIWVNHSYDAGMPVDPTSVMYRPVLDLNGIQGARSLVICLTGYIRHDRDDIMTMVSLMGAAFSKPLVANKVTHLICYKFEGEKYELAKKVKTIKLVNHRWLQDSLEAWKLLPEVDYCKSGYELSIEVEAKDSEDDTETAPENLDVRRENIVCRQNIPTENNIISQPPVKQEVSRNTSLNASETLLYAGGNHKIHESSGKEISSVETLSAPKGCDKNLGTVRSDDLNLPGEFSLKVPLPNHGTVVSEKDRALSPMLENVHVSPAGVPKSRKKQISRASPAVLLRLEKMESNSGSLASSMLNEHDVSGLDMALEDLSNGVRPHTFAATLEEAPLDDNIELEVSVSTKRKRSTSHGGSKSSISSGKQVASVERGVGKKILKVSASGSSVNSSSVLGDDCLVALFDGCSGKDSEVADITISLERKQEHDEEILQRSSETSRKKTFSNSDLMGLLSGQTTSVSGEVEMHKDESHVIEPVSCGTSFGSENMDLATFPTCRNSAAHTKPVSRKMFVTKSLCSRPAIGKERTIRHKMSLNLKKDDLSDEHRVGHGEEAPKKKSGDSFVFEKGVLPSGVTDEDSGMQCLSGSETKSPVSDEFSIPRIGGDIIPRTKLNGTGTICTEEQSTGILKSNTAAVGNQGEENKAKKMNTISGGARKRLTKGNKRALAKAEPSAPFSFSDELKSADRDKVVDEMALLDHNEASVLVRHTRNGASRKLKGRRKMEKENKPSDSLHKSINIGAGEEVCSLTPKLAKKPHNDFLKSSKPIPDSEKRTIIHEDKAGPACFILSGHRLQRKEFQSVIKKLKGRVCRDSHHWSYQATNFVVPDPVKRTEKFFAAAASGSWILKTEYLTACNEAGKFLPEQPYEWHTKCLTEDGAINLEAPRKWRLLKESTGHGAFYGMKIIIYGECIAPPLETLKRVVKAGGGTIVATSPPYTRILQSKIDFAVVSPGMPRVDMWVQEFLAHEVPCVLADYLVEFVCKPGYSLEKHVQYNTYSWAKRSLDDHVRRIEEVEDPRTPVDDSNVDEDVSCKACGRADGGDEMLICGDESGSRGCGVGMHIFCLDPPLECVPKDDWLCVACSNALALL